MTYLTFTVQLSFTTSGMNMVAAITICPKEEQLAVI
jgi:hypothetical protein